MKIQKKINVRLLKKGSQDSLRLVQYDTGVELLFNILDFELPTGTTATLYVRKKSGKFVYQEQGVTVTNKTVTVQLENQALTEYGEAFYQLEFKNGTDVISTFASSMWVDRSLANADAVESTTVVAAFEELTAEQIAAIEAAAQDQIALIQNQFNTFATKNEAANAIRGNLSGAVVFADDVSPVEHNPVVLVRGKNLFNNAKIETILTNYGSAETIDTGVRATVTNDGTWRYAMLKGMPTKNLIGKNLTLSFSAVASAENTPRVAFGFSDSTGNDRIQPAISLEYTDAISISVTKEDASRYEFVAIWLYSNHTGTGNKGDYVDYINLQVEIGEVATDYEPYLDPSTVTVKRCGKNLIPPYESYAQGGYTVAKNSDGSVTVSGASNTDGAIYLNLSPVTTKPLVLHKGVKYIFTWSSNNGRSGYLKVVGTDGANKWLTAPIGSTVISGDDYAQIIQVYAQIGASSATDPNAVGDTSLCGRYYFQLEVGETATEFEKYSAPAEYIPTADGTIEGVTSLSPNMTILTDTDGAIVECEYIRDTNKAIQNVGKGTMTVTIDKETGMASHTSAEIYAHVQSGGTAVLNNVNGVTATLCVVREDVAFFEFHSVEEGLLESTCIYDDGSIEMYSYSCEPAGRTIPTPSIAKVGQTIVVKSIDANGKPTAWEAVDLPKFGVFQDETHSTVLMFEIGMTWETYCNSNYNINGFYIDDNNYVCFPNGDRIAECISQTIQSAGMAITPLAHYDSE